MTADGARAWILTGSPETHAAPAAYGLSVIGGREHRRALLMDRMQAAAGVSA
jgi:hypothetical protein